MPYSDPERVKLWVQNNRARSNAIKRAWALRNRERNLELKRRWNRENKHKVLAVTRAYQARKLMAVPKWADLDAIDELYERADREGLHVDHIVPLQSKIVCGLHCEANLQLLPAHENIRKSNRVWPDMPV